MPEEKSPFEKKNPKLNERLPLIGIILPERFPHPYKYSWGISYEYLSGLPEPTKFMSHCLRKYLKLYVSQTRKLSRYLLTVNVSSQGVVSILTSIISLQDPLQCLKILFRLHSGRLLSYSEKGKSGKMTICCHSLSFVVICCHSLPLVVILCHLLSLIVIRCHSYHSLSFVVNRCHSMYQSSVFNSVREINMLRKEINRALSKGMSNIYLKVTIEEKN